MSDISIFQVDKYRAIFASLCALGWSLAYPLIKIGYQEFHIASDDLGGKILFAGIRFFLAGVFVSLFCGARRIPLELQRKRDLWWLVLLAVFNTALRYMFTYIGLGFNPSSRSTILDSMSGFILIIISTIIFADDRMTSQKIIGILLGLVGIISINVQPGVDYFADITLRGDGMILLNAFCGAIGGVITRVVSQKMNIMQATGLSMQLGSAIMIATGIIVGLNNPWTVGARGVLILLALIAISAVCFAVYNKLLACHPISKVAIYNALIPVLGVIFASLILHERLRIQYFVAVAFVAAGIYLVNRASTQ